MRYGDQWAVLNITKKNISTTTLEPDGSNGPNPLLYQDKVIHWLKVNFRTIQKPSSEHVQHRRIEQVYQDIR